MIVSALTLIFHKAFRGEKEKLTLQCDCWMRTGQRSAKAERCCQSDVVWLTHREEETGRGHTEVERECKSWFIACGVCVFEWDELNAFQMGSYCPTLAHLNHLPPTRQGVRQVLSMTGGNWFHPPLNTPVRPPFPLSLSHHPPLSHPLLLPFFILQIPLARLPLIHLFFFSPVFWYEPTVCRSSHRTPVGTIFLARVSYNKTQKVKFPQKLYVSVSGFDEGFPRRAHHVKLCSVASHTHTDLLYLFFSTREREKKNTI